MNTTFNINISTMKLNKKKKGYNFETYADSYTVIRVYHYLQKKYTIKVIIQIKI